MTDNWLTLSEAAAKLGISERTLHRRIANGEYRVKTEYNRKFVLLDDNSDGQDGTSDTDDIIDIQNRQIEHLKQLLDEANHARERSDTIILSLTQQLNSQTKMIEDMRNRSLWHRFKVALGFVNRRVPSTEYSH